MSPFEFEHTIKVEKFRALQPVSFDLVDEEAIKGKVARWAGLSSRIEPPDDLEGIYYLVAPPSKQALLGEYESAVKWLADTHFAREVIEVSNAEDFASRIEREINRGGAAFTS
jgi:hypothetical protein